MDESSPYQVQAQDGSYRVVDAAGNTVCNCGTMDNAQHYAALMNQAYQRGYKAGYRAGKSTATR